MKDAGCDGPATMQAGNPRRLTDWRWRRAKAVVARQGRCSSRKDDAATIELAAYLREAARCRSAKQRERLAGRWPGLGEALDVREAAGPRRTEIEARILAGLDDVRIAEATGLTAAGVAWYEQAFFDVRAHLGARDWILWRAVGPVWAGRESDQGPLLKALAWHGGPVVLEIVLAVVGGKTFSDHQPPCGMAGYPYAGVRRRLLVRQLIAAMRTTTFDELLEIIRASREAAKIDLSQQWIPAVMQQPDMDLEITVRRLAEHGRRKSAGKNDRSDPAPKDVTEPVKFFLPAFEFNPRGTGS